ncbi:hypothetical protein NM208_g8671 [Fusarium decemcellulare]|nr:hypothetical protein NM208_g8671 [Fusarium decemcellulare]
MERIGKQDYFLLTVILTIASRDSPNHSLTHRYCWDHTQRLLLGVLLAQPWAQTPRTVEGLLLLAEWLPHIQIEQTTSEAPKSLFSEDRTAWSLVGLAVRQGYLLRLDRAAFRAPVDGQCKEEEEHKRLVWACEYTIDHVAGTILTNDAAVVYMADRQISVRLGQSFWSRGPSLSTHFTAKDFPSLKPIAGVKDDDYASVLHSSLELTQILYNAHLILYASTERTLAMILDGDYARYLDDFVRAVTVWRTTWKDIQVSHKVKSTLLMMYEYIRLYVNAFSFQAVITRASGAETSYQGTHQTSKRPLAELFSRGIMSSPDGKFIFDAIGAAMNLLELMNNLDPRHVLCYLPSRYYLLVCSFAAQISSVTNTGRRYGVYAAVFLHKAHGAGAFQSLTQRREVTSLALRFVAVMADTPCTESHICHRYSRMLRNLWQRRDTHSDTLRKGPCEAELCRASRTRESSLPQPSSSRQTDGRNSTVENLCRLENMDPVISGNEQLLENEATDFSSLEGYLFGSFLPGITDFGQGQVEGDLSEQDPWTEGLAGMDSGLHGAI